MFKRPLFICSILIVSWLGLDSALAEPLSDSVMEQIEPHLLPESHPVKRKLDRIFRKKRVITDKRSLKKAGFKLKKRKSERHIYVAEHPKMPGYLFKMALDSQDEKSDIYACVKRVHGMQVIKEGIKEHGYSKYFSVPKKWVYLLPKEHAPKGMKHPKRMIIVAKKASILSDRMNQQAWKSNYMVSKDMLRALHHLVIELGLVDSVYIDNIPFTYNGKVAFIDTEHAHTWPVPTNHLERFLSPKRKRFWRRLAKP